MTPEAKAREIASALRWEVAKQSAGSVDAWVLDGLQHAITNHVCQALRDVERETLERAAQIAESFHDDDDRVDRQVKRQVAQSIRSLLQKEGG